MDNLPASPLTGKKNVAPFRVVSTCTLIRKWKEDFEIDVTEEFNSVEQIHKFRCLDSGLIFYKPTECAGGIRLYRELGRKSWYYMEEKWEYDIVAKKLQGHGRLLEVGCGRGYFLKKAAQKGWTAHGLELSDHKLENSICKNLVITGKASRNMQKLMQGPMTLSAPFRFSSMWWIHFLF